MLATIARNPRWTRFIGLRYIVQRQGPFSDYLSPSYHFTYRRAAQNVDDWNRMGAQYAAMMRQTKKWRNKIAKETRDGGNDR